MTETADERRRAPRTPVELRVEFRHLGRPNETYGDIVRNLSEGGVFLDSSVGLPLGTTVDLEISPGPGASAIRISGEVVRVEEEPVGTGSRVTARTRGMALRFVKADPGEVNRLLGLARNLSGATEARHGRNPSAFGR